LRLLVREIRVEVGHVEDGFLLSANLIRAHSKEREEDELTTLGLNGGWIFFANNLHPMVSPFIDAHGFPSPPWLPSHEGPGERRADTLKIGRLLTNSSPHTWQRTDAS
jgi:hypothetical protein